MQPVVKSYKLNDMNHIRIPAPSTQLFLPAPPFIRPTAPQGALLYLICPEFIDEIIIRNKKEKVILNS